MMKYRNKLRVTVAPIASIALLSGGFTQEVIGQIADGLNGSVNIGTPQIHELETEKTGACDLTFVFPLGEETPSPTPTEMRYVSH